MWRAFFTYCFHLAIFSHLVGAQDIPSGVSFVLGDSTLSPGPGVDTSSFSWCYRQASFVASIFTSNSPRPTFDPTHLEGIAVGVCTGNSCTGIGFTRLDKCCSIANEDHRTVASTGTSAYECLKSLADGAGAGHTKPASTSASPTDASSSGAGHNATTSNSSTGQGGRDSAASPTAPPSSGTSPSSPSTSSSSSSSSNLGNSQIHDLYSSSALVLLVGLAAYML